MCVSIYIYIYIYITACVAQWRMIGWLNMRAASKGH